MFIEFQKLQKYIEIRPFLCLANIIKQKIYFQYINSIMKIFFNATKKLIDAFKVFNDKIQYFTMINKIFRFLFEDTI